MMEQQYPSSSSSRADRKTTEKNRRNQMKALYSNLNSLLPRQQRSKEVTSLPDQLDEAVSYIKKLQMNLEKMREKKEILRMGKYQMTDNNNNNRNGGSFVGRVLNGAAGLKSMQIEIREMGSALEVVLITGLDCKFMFDESIRVIHEEGADVVNASFSVVEDTIFHTIHSKIGDSAPAGRPVASRISERLRNFVNGAT